MSVTWDMMTNWYHTTYDIHDMFWLGGALTGLDVYSNREPDWLWTQFMEDIRAMQSFYDIKTRSITEDPTEASILDVLGGYVSVTGTISAVGLSFPIPFNTGGKIQQYLSGLNIIVHPYEMIIPLDELDRFIALVSLRGPVEDMLREVMEVEV